MRSLQSFETTGIGGGEKGPGKPEMQEYSAQSPYRSRAHSRHLCCRHKFSAFAHAVQAAVAGSPVCLQNLGGSRLPGHACRHLTGKFRDVLWALDGYLPFPRLFSHGLAIVSFALRSVKHLAKPPQVRFHVLVPSPSRDTHALKLVFNFLKRMFFRQAGRLIKTPAM